MTRTVAFLVFPNHQILDTVGPLQAFATANEVVRDAGASEAPYELVVLSAAGGLIASSAGVCIDTMALSGMGISVDTLLVSGGRGVFAAAEDDKLITWVGMQRSRVRRLCSVCTGAFVLAAAGALDGRRAVTHWSSCDALSRAYPQTSVEPDAIFIQDGNVWTSAGITAGIDLALTLIEDDLGRRTAMEVARRLVVFVKRPGGQSQFSNVLQLQTSDDPQFEWLNAWIQENLSADLSVDGLAARMGMSPRNFSRQFRQRTGLSPAKAVERVRLDAARCLLETSEIPIKAVASSCGFGDDERLRRSFQRVLGTSPANYRALFGRSAHI